MLALCMVVVGGGLGMLLKLGYIPPGWQFVMLGLIACIPLVLSVLMMVHHGRIA
jgi:hypothetical protein